MEKDGGRVEKQTKAKLCNGRVGGDVHAASGGVAYSLVYTDLIGGQLFGWISICWFLYGQARCR